MQECLQQQVALVSSLLEPEQLQPSLLLQASRLQVSHHAAHPLRRRGTLTTERPTFSRLPFNVQSDLEGALGRISRQREGMRSSEEVQRLHRLLVGSLEELLALASQRLEQRPQLEVRDIVELQQQYYNHTVSTAAP